jgi:hypothetical protein
MGEGDDQLLMVPVRFGRCGSVAVRTGRLDTGERVGLVFTSAPALAQVFGSEQAWIPLNGGVARQMFEQAGAVQMRIDALPVLAPELMSDPALAAGERFGAAPALVPASAEAFGRPAPTPRRHRLPLAHLSLAIRHAH